MGGDYGTEHASGLYWTAGPWPTWALGHFDSNGLAVLVALSLKRPRFGDAVATGVGWEGKI